MRVALRRGRFPPKDAGFTLLEVLVAASVLGMILVLLAQGARFGVQAGRAQLEAGERRGDLEVIDHALRRMIALAEPGVYPAPATLRGTARVMSFTTGLPLDGDGRLQRADVVLSTEAGRLLLRWTPHRHVELFGTKPEWRSTVVLDGVERVEFAFQASGPSGRWFSTWNADQLPALVRVQIVFPGGSRRRWPALVVAPVREPLEE